MTFLTILWKTLVFNEIYNEPKFLKNDIRLAPECAVFTLNYFFKDCAPFVVAVSSRDLWRHWSFSKTDINSGSGFSSDWKSSAAVQSSLGRILWKIFLLMKGKAFVQFTDQLITKLMQCWIMAINNFGNTSIILRWKFYKQVILYRKWFSGMI